MSQTVMVNRVPRIFDLVLVRRTVLIRVLAALVDTRVRTALAASRASSDRTSPVVGGRRARQRGGRGGGGCPRQEGQSTSDRKGGWDGPTHGPHGTGVGGPLHDTVGLAAR